MSLPDALLEQARNNESLGSPFTARVLRLLAAHIQPGTPLTDRMFGWQGDIGPSGHSVPLRLLGGLHALVLTARAPDLAALYPPNPAPDDATLAAGLMAALHDHADFLNRWIDLPPQTNEVRRSAALIAGGHWLAARFPLPIVLSELGASGGLNLMWDRYALVTPGGTLGPADSPVRLTTDLVGGQPSAARVEVVERRGVDLNPLDPQDPEDALRLTAYLWADQPDRLERTRAAIAMNSARLDKGDAAAWLAERLARPREGHMHIVYHTVAWQYFPPETQAACLHALETAGARATEDAPLARLSMEADDDGRGAALTATVWPGGHHVALGRVDFHGRWLDWQAG